MTYMPEYAQSLSQLGAYYILKEEFNKALIYLDSSYIVYEKFNTEKSPNFDIKKAKVLINISYLLEKKGDTINSLNKARNAHIILSNHSDVPGVKEVIKYADSIVFKIIEEQISPVKENIWQKIKEKDKIDFQIETIKIIEEEYNKNKNYRKIKILLSESYGDLSWYYLFRKEFKKSEKAALISLSLDSNQQSGYTNLFHAYLFQGLTKEAIDIYDELKETSFEDGKSFQNTLIDDLNNLKANGVSNNFSKEFLDLFKK